MTTPTIEIDYDYEFCRRGQTNVEEFTGMRIVRLSSTGYEADGMNLTTAEAYAVWSELTAHFLSTPPEGSEFAAYAKPNDQPPTRDALAKPRPGDEFPNVGYVRYMKHLLAPA